MTSHRPWRLGPIPMLLCAAVNTGCSGGTSADPRVFATNSARTALRAQRSPAVSANVSFVIGITPSKRRAQQIGPKYISPSTQSLRILTDNSNPVVVNLTPSSPNCAPNPAAPGSYICTASLTVATGNHVFTVTAYDRTAAQGSVLSTNSTGTIYVKAIGPTRVSIVLEGLVQYAVLELATTHPPIGKAAAIGINAILEDADENLIIGPAFFEHPVTLTTTDPVAGPLSKAVLNSPADAAGITVNYTGANIASITFGASATGLPDTNVTKSILLPGTAAVGAGKIYVANINGAVTTYDAAGTQTAPTLPVRYGFGVAVDPAGKIFVTSQGDNRIVSFNPDGTPSRPTITAGLSEPHFIAVDAAGKIYVTNVDDNFNGDNTVTTYTAQGTQTIPTIHFPTVPGGVAVDVTGKIYATSSESTLTTYAPDGTPTTPTIGGFAINNSGGVAVDTAGKIYVTNFSANSVTTFNSDGSSGTPTITAGLDGPVGVAVDAVGKIFVTNVGSYPAYAGSVTTYNPDGTRTTPTITAGLNRPLGIAVH